MPNPGVQSSSSRASGGNQFQGEYHLDWYNNSLQGSNMPDEYIVPTAFNNAPIREHSNEIDRYYDHDINAGGPIKKDKMWLFGTYRKQFNAVAQPNFRSTRPSTPSCGTRSARCTYQMNQKNKLIGYYQWGQKTQPNRLPFATYTYASPEQTYMQNSGSWVYKGEWNSTVSDKLYLEARYGDFGYYFPLITNSDENYFLRDTGRSCTRSARTSAGSSIAIASSTTSRPPTSSTPRKGSHTFKIGARAPARSSRGKATSQRRGGTATSSSLRQRRRRRR